MNCVSPLLVTFLLVRCLAWAQDTASDKETPKQPPNMQELLELANPGPEHAQLATYVGTGKVRVLFGGKLFAEGTSDLRMAAGDRFLLCDYKGQGRQGPLEGIYTIGFDRRHGDYTIQAIDSFGTYFVVARGKPNGDAKRIKLYGKDDDPHLKTLTGVDKEFGFVLDLSDPETLTIETFMIDNRTDARTERTMMSVEFLRAE